jgi:hypothetical protein
MIDNQKFPFWTFPEFKSPMGDSGANPFETTKNISKLHLQNIVFPDPKYYMIGFSTEKSHKRSKDACSDWGIQNTELSLSNNEASKQSVNKSSVVSTDNTRVTSWRKAASKLKKNAQTQLSSNRYVIIPTVGRTKTYGKVLG